MFGQKQLRQNKKITNRSVKEGIRLMNKGPFAPSLSAFRFELVFKKKEETAKKAF